MKILCAACHYMHDSEEAPFKNSIIRDTFAQNYEVPVINPKTGDQEPKLYYVKQCEASFVCPNCSTENEIHVKWAAIRDKAEVEDESS